MFIHLVNEDIVALNFFNSPVSCRSSARCAITSLCKLLNVITTNIWSCKVTPLLFHLSWDSVQQITVPRPQLSQ